MSSTTILRGCVELKSDLAHCPAAHARAAGRGGPAVDGKDPGLEAALLELLASETTGDPMGRRANAKRSSLPHLRQALTAQGHPTSRMTVAKLLHKLEYSPKANTRRTEARGASPKERNARFEHISEQRSQFGATGAPIISVDTKKELIGNFKNTGRTWSTEADRVLVHNWPQDAIAQAVPYGVYEVRSNLD